MSGQATHLRHGRVDEEMTDREQALLSLATVLWRELAVRCCLTARARTIVTEAEQERARIVSIIRETEAEYAREAARLRCGSRRDPRWDDWARAVHKRSMARVLALRIERGE